MQVEMLVSKISYMVLKEKKKQKKTKKTKNNSSLNKTKVFSADG